METSNAAIENGVFDLILHSGPVVQLVLLILAALSVFCWAIIITKIKLMKSVANQNEDFLQTFWKGKNMEEISSKTHSFDVSPIAGLFTAGYKELKKLSMADRNHWGSEEMENIQRALSRASSSEISNLENQLGWLATTASAAPFIGLFGTVWGIMNSFQEIGISGQASLAIVAPGISEALIATAAGLAAAIPAVVAYNNFVNRIKKVIIELECFSQDFLNIIQRSVLGEQKK